MARKTSPTPAKLSSDQIAFIEERMARLARRNPSWGIDPGDHKRLFEYLVAQKLAALYDDEVFESLRFVDRKRTGKDEELLDAYMVLDRGEEIHLELFQFKFRDKYDGGVSTKELYAFVDRMNRVFLRGDLQDERTLEAFAEVRGALDAARESNPRARTRIHCHYVVNGQNLSRTDPKVDEIRETFANDRQAYGFTFATYGGLDVYNICAHGRIPIGDETIEMNFGTGPSPILDHKVGPNPNGMPIRVVVGFVNVNQLIRLVDRYDNNELFERNVRLFLGVGKDVNRRIIETVTGDRSSWFGYMNNGVSVTAESVEVDLPARDGRVKVRLSGMQIINGCQTVNALYHAKYDRELRDRFQGNSNVLVRIYEVPSENAEFMESLIVATNAQNAIRPEDFLSNDPRQIAAQSRFLEYGVWYERKEGETPPGKGHVAVFSKEKAAMSYLAVFGGKAARLRNSLSRREFFRQGPEYAEVFRFAPDDSEDSAGADAFAANARRRALEMLAARAIEEKVRSLSKDIREKKEKGALRKGAFYLSWIVFLSREAEIRQAIDRAAILEPSPSVAERLKTEIESAAGGEFDSARRIFETSLAKYLRTNGGNEDSALKNSKFAEYLREEIASIAKKT